MFLEGDYKKAYPMAKLLATDAAIKRHGDPNLHFDGGKCIMLKSFSSVTVTSAVWGRDPPNTKYGFELEVNLIMSGLLPSSLPILNRWSTGKWIFTTSNRVTDQLCLQNKLLLWPQK